MPDRGNLISVLAIKNLKLKAFVFKRMEYCSKTYKIKCVNSTSVLQYQHQWELEQKKIDNVKAPKVDKNNWVKNMENIVLPLKLVTGMRGLILAYVVWQHVKVAHILSEYGAYLNLDEEMIARAPIVYSRSNLKLNQETLDRAYLDHQCDTFKIDNALVFQILYKTFTDMDANIYAKQRKGMQERQAVFFNFHKWFLGLDPVARQATEAEEKLQDSYIEGERMTWNWDKHVTIHKE